MPLIAVNDPHDARIEAYTLVRERDLVGRQGRFVAEGEVVLRHLLKPGSRYEAESVLITENRVAALADLFETTPVPVYVASSAVMDSVVGFPIHRGILGIGRIGAPATADEVLANPGPADRILVVVGVGNHDNMGGLFRAAAGFGARAVVLDSTACDPLYRKAIRVSVGASLITPWVRLGSGQDLIELLSRLGYAPWALTPSGEEVLSQARAEGPVAVIVGAEGPGLSPSILAKSRRLSIPMSPGFDSLNVGTAAAIALHHLASQL